MRVFCAYIYTFNLFISGISVNCFRSWTRQYSLWRRKLHNLWHRWPEGHVSVTVSSKLIAGHSWQRPQEFWQKIDDVIVAELCRDSSIGTRTRETKPNLRNRRQFAWRMAANTRTFDNEGSSRFDRPTRSVEIDPTLLVYQINVWNSINISRFYPSKRWGE